jgi:radical SAM protein with 4Fe4S-binding SPASM domain
VLDHAERSARHDYFVSCAIAMPPCLFDRSRYARLGFGFCAAGTDRAYYTIDPVGNVRPCNHSRTVIGNVLDDAFEAMAGGGAMRRFMAARPAFCAGCRHRGVPGGCKERGKARRHYAWIRIWSGSGLRQKPLGEGLGTWARG